MSIHKITALLMCVFTTFSCSVDEKSVSPTITKVDLPIGDELNFRELGEGQTGISFTNKLKESDAVNYYSYEYLYNGGGVSLADFDNDGFQDIFFVCNMGYNRLYKNNGQMSFTDISKSSNIRSSRDWCTGSTVVDINNDGLLDLYVSRSGWFEDSQNRANLLYINKGNMIFEESAERYGIADKGYSTQSSFFDADGDGDLDLYVMNHPDKFSEELTQFISKTKSPPKFQSDRLYINESGKYVDKSEQWGISNYGHGLGIVTADINLDGRADIYISNDYQQHDFIYINKGNRFEDESKKMLKHMSKFSMGIDISDFDNDGDQDVITVEMMPTDNYRKKTNMASMNPKLYSTLYDNGFQDQEMHNSLQVNNGGEFFQDKAYLYGIAETDWSWAPLFADLNGDMRKDLFIANGYRKDVLDKDLQKKVEKAKIKGTFKYSQIEHILTTTESKNLFFKNTPNEFIKQSGNSFSSKFNSNGASYGDLDNDGDLDIVCNNMESPSIIYENLSSNNVSTKLRLSSKADKFGLGSQIKITTENSSFYYDNTSTRGFQSSVSPIITIPGLDAKSINNIEITWANGKTERYTEGFDSELHLKEGDGEYITKKKNTLAKSLKSISYTYAQKKTNDYKIQPLLPYNVSDQGPYSVTADLDNDGVNEIIISGGQGQATGIYNFENDKLKLSKLSKSLSSQLNFEDSGICVFDLNKDGLVDIYVSRGSYAHTQKADLQDMIYINKGKSFELLKSPITTNSTCPITIDFDNDGDQDIFVGGGYVHGQYPKGTDSYILVNNDGVLTAEILHTGIKSAITDAMNIDYNKDGIQEILLVGEWSNPSLLTYENNEWKDISKNVIPTNLKGMWSAIDTIDIDNDGKAEVLLGNLGTNSKYNASVEKPLNCYSTDVNKNGNYEVVLSSFEDDNEFPIRGRQCSSEQFPELVDNIESYDIFAKSDVQDIYGSALDEGLKFSCTQLKSGYLKLNSYDKYDFVSFDNKMQHSKIYDFESSVDINNCTIVYYHGNLQMEVESGLLDGFEFESWNTCTNEVKVISTNSDKKFVRSMITLPKHTEILLLSSNGESLTAFIGQ